MPDKIIEVSEYFKSHTNRYSLRISRNLNVKQGENEGKYTLLYLKFRASWSLLRTRFENRMWWKSVVDDERFQKNVPPKMKKLTKV